MKLRELGDLLEGQKNCHGTTYFPSHCARILGYTAREECSGFQVLRHSSKDGQLFWGCSRWPECRATSPFIFMPWQATELRSRLAAPAYPRPSSRRSPKRSRG